MDRDYLFDEWLNTQIRRAANKRKYTKRFIGERAYPHLDDKLFYSRIGHNAEQGAWLKDLVTHTERLRSHGFLPFIKNGKRQRRFKEPPHDYAYTSARGDRDQKLFPHIKFRPIMYASHRDACIFSFYSYCLGTLYEPELERRDLQENVIAYRSIDGKNNVDFARYAFDEMHKRDAYDCMMLDVKGFFDNLDHALLWKIWNNLLPGGFAANPDQQFIFDQITTFRHLDGYEAIGILKANKRDYLFKEGGSFRFCRLDDYNELLKKAVRTNNSSHGIPQGSPISGMLANLYLLDFDSAMRQLVVDELGGVYQRYSDDILIVCPVGSAKAVYDTMQQLLMEVQLKLGDNKTEAFRKTSGERWLTNITGEIEPGGNAERREAQYLGFHFDGETIGFRPSTLSKHVRGRRKSDYMKGAYNKIGSKKIARQLNKIRRVVKKRMRLL